MTLQNFIYLVFAAVWLSGLIWAGVIAFKSRKGEAMSLDNVHIPIDEDKVLSIAQINNRLEFAVLSNIGAKYGYDPFFITENYFDDLYESLM